MESNVALVELIPCAALLYSGTGKILAANRLFCDLVAYTPEELLRRSVADLTGSEEQQLDEAVWLTELVTKSGDTILCEVSRKCLDGGRPRRCLALVRKFTEQSDSELILHAIDEGFLLLDRDFRIQRMNDEALRIDGRPRGALIGKTHWEAWPGTEHLPIADAYRKAMRERRTATAEQVYSVKGGEMWHEVRIFPVEDGLAIFYRDITERKRAESALRDAQSRLEAALNAAEIGTWTWDIQADRVYADRNFAAMFGIAPEVANGGPIAAYFNAVHPDDLGDMRLGLEQSRVSGEPYHKSFRVRASNGCIRYMQGRGVFATDAEGRPTRMSGAVLDVTRQQLAEQALKSSELTFRTLANNIAQLAWMADREGSVYWYNNRWFEYTGTTLDEMQGWGWSKVHHPDHVERVVALFRKRIVEEQEAWEDTFPLRGADGKYRWFLSRALPIRDERGRVLRWLGTNTDITLQREADQRKDDFLALLAHELRSPLAPISTAAQLLKAGGRNPEYVQRSSEIIDRQVKHMSELVDDLLDVSRVTRGLVSIEQEEVNVADVVNDAVEQSRPLIESRKQQLALDVRDDAAGVLGDRTRLVQVLANLLNNAAKYTQQGGLIKLTVEVRDGHVVVSVADNGMGMDEDLLPRVFELFAQGEPTPDRRGGGLGLGLALVKSIVALHGGSVTAESPGRGKGSTFIVTLPLLKHEGAGRPLHILLVDRGDDEDAALPAALEAEGHMVALCGDEPSALETARELHPDAVLIRTDMPGVEGYALARQLRALHPEDHATFIALSDSDQAHDKVIARGAGFDHLLERPVAMGALRRVLP